MANPSPSNSPPFFLAEDCIKPHKSKGETCPKKQSYLPCHPRDPGSPSDKVADLSPIHFGKQSATHGTYGSKYWFPGFGFDSGPNLQLCL